MFDGFIRDWACWTPRAAALVTPERTVSYARFDAEIDRLGAGLIGLGVAPRSPGVVAIALETPHLQLLAMCALARLGVASAPSGDPGADLRLADRDHATGPPPLRVTREWLAETLSTPTAPLPALELDADAVGRVMLSSGTTRTPKRIGMSWRRIEIANFAALRTYGIGKTGAYIPSPDPSRCWASAPASAPGASAASSPAACHPTSWSAGSRPCPPVSPV